MRSFIVFSSSLLLVLLDAGVMMWVKSIAHMERKTFR
jgi:hypothetical protein